MAVTPETAREALRGAHARRRGGGDRLGVRAAREAGRDLVRRRLLDLETFPRERVTALLEEFACAGRELPRA
ncbi:MAG: hypothetical protein ACXWZ8_11345 [Gaiellaceae bacterium]